MKSALHRISKNILAPAALCGAAWLGLPQYTPEARAQATLWSEESGAPRDTSHKHQLYVGSSSTSMLAFGTMVAFDISSWQFTSGTKQENINNLEARLRSTKTNIDGSVAASGAMIGYHHRLTPKIGLLAEASFQNGAGYSGLIVGGITYTISESENLKFSLAGKAGFGRQVVYHSKLQNIQDSLTVNGNRRAVDYGKVVFTRNGNIVEGDKVYLSLTGIQLQGGIVADYKLTKHVVLKAQAGLQTAMSRLDQIILEGSTENRGDFFKLVPRFTYEYATDDASIVKPDLSREKAAPSTSSVLFGGYLQVAVGISF